MYRTSKALPLLSSFSGKDDSAYSASLRMTPKGSDSSFSTIKRSSSIHQSFVISNNNTKPTNISAKHRNSLGKYRKIDTAKNLISIDEKPMRNPYRLATTKMKTNMNIGKINFLEKEYENIYGAENNIRNINFNIEKRRKSSQMKLISSNRLYTVDQSNNSTQQTDLINMKQSFVYRNVERRPSRLDNLGSKPIDRKQFVRGKTLQMTNDQMNSLRNKLTQTQLNPYIKGIEDFKSLIKTNMLNPKVFLDKSILNSNLNDNSASIILQDKLNLEKLLKINKFCEDVECISYEIEGLKKKNEKALSLNLKEKTVPEEELNETQENLKIDMIKLSSDRRKIVYENLFKALKSNLSDIMYISTKLKIQSNNKENEPEELISLKGKPERINYMKNLKNESDKSKSNHSVRKLRFSHSHSRDSSGENMPMVQTIQSQKKLSGLNKILTTISGSENGSEKDKEFKSEDSSQSENEEEIIIKESKRSLLNVSNIKEHSLEHSILDLSRAESSITNSFLELCEEGSDEICLPPSRVRQVTLENKDKEWSRYIQLPSILDLNQRISRNICKGSSNNSHFTSFERMTNQSKSSTKRDIIVYGEIALKLKEMKNPTKDLDLSKTRGCENYIGKYNE
jgi:hypothetical protein